MSMADVVDSDADGTAAYGCYYDADLASNLYDSRILRRYRIITSASSTPERGGGVAGNGYVYDYNPWDAMQYVAQEEQPKPPKYDPGRARQLWQPGYPRVRPLRNAKALPNLMPKFNQVQHTSRPKYGRRGRK